MSARPDPLAGLHVLADDGPWPHDPVAQARGACRGGASVVQLRAKRAVDRQVLAWGRAIRELTRAAGVLFFVNDRFDLALACDADGVHLGQGDVAPARLPAAVRARLRVGRSTHTWEEVRQALHEPVDYVAFGPVFGTTSTDTGFTARGLTMLREVAGHVAPLPLVAIGGIDASNAADVAGTGVDAAAVLSAVADAGDPAAATAALLAAFRRHAA